MDISEQILQDYLSGKLPAEDTLEVQLFLSEHMEDPRIASLMEACFEDTAPAASPRAVKALLSTRGRLGLVRKPGRVARLYALAAAAAVLIAIPAALHIGWRLHREPETVTWQEICVPLTQKRSVTLPDGTILTLNAGSRVTWPDHFTGNTREIFLDGEVMANVAKDSEHPFVIHTGEVDVKVLGTTFDLKAYRGATLLELMLREGSVEMAFPSAEQTRQLRLTPGDLAQLDHSTGEITLGKIPPESYRTFADEGAFSFFNVPLLDIASELERGFGRRIVVADDDIASQRFLAFFTNGESLEEILRLLCRNGGLRTVLRGDTTYIYNK